MSFFNPVRVIRTRRETPRWIDRFRWATSALVGVALLLVILRSGYRLFTTPLQETAVVVFNLLVLAVYVVDVVLGFVATSSRWQHLKRRWFDIALLVPIAAAVAAGGTGITFVILRQLLVVGQAFSRTRRFTWFLEEMRRQPVRPLAISFLAMIAVGTLLLTFPAATRDGSVTGIIDALFTATSATCVTGLIVLSTPGHWSGFGQAVILVLLQLGGLGIMTFSASLAVVLGRRLGLGERRTVSDIVGESRDIDIARVLRYIVTFTLVAEGIGAVLLLTRLLPDFPTWTGALWNAAFHSVSAFCNAGFSLFEDSLVRYHSDPVINLVIMALIIAGGLGFVVVRELLNRDTLRLGPARNLRRLSSHARLVLVTTTTLTAAGVIVFFFTEYDRALAGLPTATKLLAALFQSVTARTAGFNTVPLGTLHPATLFLWGVLMFIGASPGGTGGGIKTSTFAILVLSVKDRVFGREDVSFGRRVITRDVVYRATAIAAVAAAIVGLFFALLLLTERAPFQNLLFETLSAFGTVGLSTGLTPELSQTGKVAVAVLMYIGRLGPLTLALAMRPRRAAVAIGYPDARVMVG
jgi:trk system potassium uptake protein TrkH